MVDGGMRGHLGRWSVARSVAWSVDLLRGRYAVALRNKCMSTGEDVLLFILISLTFPALLLIKCSFD